MKVTKIFLAFIQILQKGKQTVNNEGIKLTNLRDMLLNPIHQVTLKTIVSVIIYVTYLNLERSNYKL